MNLLPPGPWAGSKASLEPLSLGEGLARAVHGLSSAVQPPPAAEVLGGNPEALAL